MNDAVFLFHSWICPHLYLQEGSILNFLDFPPSTLSWGFFSCCFVQWLYYQLTTETWLRVTPHTCEKVLMFPVSIYQSSLRVLFYWLIDLFWIVDHCSSGCSWIHKSFVSTSWEDCTHVLAYCQLYRKLNLEGVKNVTSCTKQQCVPGCASVHCFLPKKLHVTEIEHPTFI